MYSDPLATFVTTTSYGSWLPGDARGYVDNGTLYSSRRYLRANVERETKLEKVVFSSEEQAILFESLRQAATEFGYQLTDAVVEATHLHWIIGHGDAVPVMAGRLKSRMRQRLDRGRIWTSGFSHRLLFKEEDVYAARNYLTKHPGLRLLCERPADRA